MAVVKRAATDVFDATAWHASLSALLTQNQAAVVAAKLFDALDCHSFHLRLCRRGGCGQWQRQCGVETIPQEPPFCPAERQRQHHRLHHSEICRPAPHSQVSHVFGSVIWQADTPDRVARAVFMGAYFSLPLCLAPHIWVSVNMLQQTIHFDRSRLPLFQQRPLAAAGPASSSCLSSHCNC